MTHIFFMPSIVPHHLGQKLSKVKTYFPLFLVLFAGCSKEKPDVITPRVEMLESNLFLLRSEASLLKTNVLDLSNLVASQLKEVADLSSNDAAFFSEVLRIANASQKTATNQPIKAPFRPVVPLVYKDGIPLSVYNQISDKAAVKWPGNYNMQAYEIDLQVESYKKLHQ